MRISEVERRALEYVMKLERDAGRDPQDVHTQRRPYDIDSPPRKIEVKAYGGSARGGLLPLEESQVREAQDDPENFCVYVVDNIALAANGEGEMKVHVLRGRTLQDLLAGVKPRLTYWPTLRVSVYDDAEQMP